MAYSVEEHVDTLQRFVGAFTPDLFRLRKKGSIEQPGLARALFALCLLDMSRAVPGDPVSRQESLRHMQAPAPGDSERFDDVTRPFYKEYVELLGPNGRGPRELPDHIITQANEAIDTYVPLVIIDLSTKGAEYENSIGWRAGQLAVERHTILTSEFPTSRPVPFPPFDELQFQSLADRR